MKIRKFAIKSKAWRHLGGMMAVLVLLATVAGSASKAGGGESAPMGRHFGTLPPGAALPSGAECARMIAPTAETKPANVPFNRAIPTVEQLAEFHAHPTSGSNLPAADFAEVDGNYTGSTEMILRWAACKWGIDEDVVLAQAWTESKWVQGGAGLADGGGDRRFNRSDCVRDGFTALWNFGCKGCCFQSWGILQTKVFYAPGTWPMIRDSTAFNADYRYAEERACINGDYRGYFASAAQQPNTYSADLANSDLDRILWGCTGMHFSGSWYDNAARRYIAEIKGDMVTKPWQIH